jgi:hypothetical protein
MGRYWKLKAFEAFRFLRKGLQSHPFLIHPGLDVSTTNKNIREQRSWREK